MTERAYENKLRLQVQNSQRSAQKAYLRWLYSLIKLHFHSNQKLLEIGSGAGISRLFLPNLPVTRTDILPWAEGLVDGGVNAEALPFANSHFDGTFAVDVFHHLQYPLRVLQELVRVINPGNQIVLIEPYVSFLSFPVYRIFHDEKTTRKKLFEATTQMVSEDPSDGDQGLAQALFISELGRLAILNAFGKDIEVDVQYLSPLSFFATGGLTHPLPVPSFFIRSLILLETRLPQSVMRLIASRICIVITRLR